MNTMKLDLIFFIILMPKICWALSVPSDFEATKSFGTESKMWVQPRSLETINLSTEKLDESQLSQSKDSYAEIKEMIELKARTLSWILNIKNWKISDSVSSSKDGTQLIIFFGSYVDSSEELIMFAEVYWIPKNGSSESYLISRAKQPYSAKELAERFKVQLP